MKIAFEYVSTQNRQGIHVFEFLVPWLQMQLLNLSMYILFHPEYAVGIRNLSARRCRVVKISVHNTAVSTCRRVKCHVCPERACLYKYSGHSGEFKIFNMYLNLHILNNELNIILIFSSIEFD